MTDIRKALEAAADAACEANPMCYCGIPCRGPDVARAAVLAFLRAMPPLICEFEDGTTVDTKALLWLAAAIEKEPQP